MGGGENQLESKMMKHNSLAHSIRNFQEQQIRKYCFSRQNVSHGNSCSVSSKPSLIPVCM